MKDTIQTIRSRTYVFIVFAEILMGCLIIAGCEKRPAQDSSTKESAEISKQRMQRAQSPTQIITEPYRPKWDIGSHFGMVTTVWISQEAIKDKFLIAQVLHTINQRYENGAVWFFDDKQHTPSGVPMTDEQMLHWVGMYDTTQSDTFSYIEVTNTHTSPPEIKTIKTNIRPGYAE